MKKILLIAILCIFTSGCNQEALSSKQTDNPNFNVEKLFSEDGCTVYRFYDAGIHYFSKCENNSSVSAKHSCGKNCSKEERINTSYTTKRI